MWHDHMTLISPGDWNVACGSGIIHQVAAPCNVAGGCAITCHEFRPNVRHIGILHLVSILTITPQSTCHSAPVCEILSKSDHPRQKKMTSCRFLRRRISAILDFRGPIMGSLKSPCTTSRKTPWRGHQGLKTCLEARTCLENENPCFEKSRSVL